MKNLILTFFAFLFLSVATLAAPVKITTTAELKPSEANKVSKGITVSLVKDVMEVTIETGGQNLTSSGDQFAGLALGYSNIDIGNVGYLTRLVVSSYNLNDTNSMSYRLEGNATYGFSDSFYALGGFNYAILDFAGQFRNSRSTSISADFGFQIGTGYQMTENFGLQLIYAQMTNGFDEDIEGIGQITGDLIVSGAELSLVGTF